VRFAKRPDFGRPFGFRFEPRFLARGMTDGDVTPFLAQDKFVLTLVPSWQQKFKLFFYDATL